MTRPIVGPAVCRRFLVLSAVALILAGCSTPAQSLPPRTPHDVAMPSDDPSRTAATVANDPFSDLPDEARVASRRGDPRPAAYWALWNTCAPENRAEVAAAHGGRAAGWVLVDDILADPGIHLGDLPLSNCEESLALLQARTTSGDDTEDPAYRLAAALLAAELNLNVGAETCPIAEEAVVGSHLVLSNLGFDGTGTYGETTSDEVANAIPRLIELLEGYNRGQLCR